MLVSQILKNKGDMVFTASPSDTVQAAAALLHARRVGAMVVLDADHDVAGIVSERDIVNALAAFGASVLEMPAGQVMSRGLLTCTLDQTADDLLGIMTASRVRHLPVVEEGRLLGIVSIGDVVKLKLDDAAAEVGLLRDYVMAGR